MKRDEEGVLVADSDHRVPPLLLDVAEQAATMLRRFYVAGGGSVRDFRTDLAHVLDAVLAYGEHSPCLLQRRPKVISTATYKGPDRRARERRQECQRQVATGG